MICITPFLDYEALCNDNWEDFPELEEADLKFQLAVTLKALRHVERLNHAILHQVTNQNPAFIKAVIDACLAAQIVRHRGRQGRAFDPGFLEDCPRAIWGAVEKIEQPFLDATQTEPESRVALLSDETG